MVASITLRRIGKVAQRRGFWRVSSDFVHNRPFSDGSGSDIARMSDQEATRKALELAAREDRLDFQTAARLLMSSPQDERKFGWDFHLVQFFFACLPPLAVYGVAQWSRSEQRRMEKERDVEIEKIVQAELEIEMEVELEEVAAMLNSNNTDLEAVRARLDAMEERLMRLEPMLRQTGNSHQKAQNAATKPAKDSPSPVPPQEVDVKQKPSIARSADVEESTNNQKKDEGAAKGYWPWLRGLRQRLSGDVHAQEHEQISKHAKNSQR